MSADQRRRSGSNTRRRDTGRRSRTARRAPRRASAAAGGSRRRSRRRRLRIDPRLIALAAAAVVILGIFSLGWHGFRYITDTGIRDVRGVDVSSYQPDVDWDVLKSEGLRFAFIKATEGSSHVDPDFEDNWKGAHKAGMLAGAYHFLSFDTDGDTQAQNFIDTVRKKRKMLPPAVDVELYGDYSSAPPSKERVREILDVVLEDLEDRYDMKPILYVNNHVYDLYLAGDDYKEYPIWISDPDENDTLSDGREWTFCQYSFSGISDGIGDGKKVDLDRFRGNLWELKHHEFRDPD